MLLEGSLTPWDKRTKHPLDEPEIRGFDSQPSRAPNEVHSHRKTWIPTVPSSDDPFQRPKFHQTRRESPTSDQTNPIPSSKVLRRRSRLGILKNPPTMLPRLCAHGLATSSTNPGAIEGEHILGSKSLDWLEESGSSIQVCGQMGFLGTIKSTFKIPICNTRSPWSPATSSRPKHTTSATTVATRSTGTCGPAPPPCYAGLAIDVHV